LALASHWPLDDLNVDPISHIYHGYGDDDWRTLLMYLYTGAIITLCVIISALNIRLIPYGFAATIPDWEHPVRWLKGKKDYWIHDSRVFWHPVMRTQWGMVIRAVVMGLLLYIVWR